IRQSNTLKAIRALEKVRCLTDTEYRALDSTYRFLRKIEHRLQLMFDQQTHRMPDKPEELRKLALRMGYEGREPRGEGRERNDPPSLASGSSPSAPRLDPLNAFL